MPLLWACFYYVLAYVCVCVHRPPGTADIGHLQMCCDIFLSAKREQQPRSCTIRGGDVEAHTRRRAARLRQSHAVKDEEPRGIVSQRRKCRRERESAGEEKKKKRLFYAGVHRDRRTSAAKHWTADMRAAAAGEDRFTGGGDIFFKWQNSNERHNFGESKFKVGGKITSAKDILKSGKKKKSNNM